MKFSKKSSEKPKKEEKAESGGSVLSGIEISEATARKVWAGEVAIATAVAFIAVIIALIG